jgi:hypothetical protein
MGGWESFLREYGWFGFLAYLIGKEALPFLRDKVWPRKVAEAEAAQKRQDEERNRLKTLEERSIQVEERQMKAMESISLSYQQMALALTTGNERMNTIMTMQIEHDRFTREAMIGTSRKTSRVSSRGPGARKGKS